MSAVARRSFGWITQQLAVLAFTLTAAAPVHGQTETV
jgi:hypothetical protein